MLNSSERSKTHQLLPNTLHAKYHCLSTELSLCSYFQRNPRYFGREDAKLEDHVVDRFLKGGHLSFDLGVDGFRETGGGVALNRTRRGGEKERQRDEKDGWKIDESAP